MTIFCPNKMWLLPLVLVSIFISVCADSQVRNLPPGEPSEHVNRTVVRLRMPGIIPKKNDDYLCTAFKLDASEGAEQYVTQFKIEGTAERAHHMLLYGCGGVPSEELWWDCGHHGTCAGSSSIMFAWAKNAPPTSLPPSVGFKMGGSSEVKYLVMQIHYAHTLPPGETDSSGMDLEVTREEQQYMAGIYLLIGNGIIPPHRPKVHADACCVVRTHAPFHLFAYRTHAHALGRVITGYKIDRKTRKQEEIARGNPQWPQAFYGMPHVFDVHNGDKLMARCTYDSTNKNKTTTMGSTAGDEMCNLYLMYYTDSKKGTPYTVCADMCFGYDFPEDSDVPLPPNPLLEEHALHGNHGNTNDTITINNKMSINLEQLEYSGVFGKKDSDDGTIPEPEKKAHSVHRKPGPPVDEQYEEAEDQDPEENHVEHHHSIKTTPRPERVYPDNYIADPKWSASMLGQPSAVGIDSKGNVIIFHRADRAWGGNTFGFDNRLTNPQAGPISNTTLMMLDPSNSRLIREAGRSMFYLPHGLTIDDQDCLWVTDVGAHQVFKLTPMKESGNSEVQILLELGKKLQPGSGDGEFCKPTSVAVLPGGDFFVADGYCNSRVIKYTKAGVKIAEWSSKTANPMVVPHSITIVPEREMVCVADRENGRIQCFAISDGRFQMMIKFPEFKSYVYAVSYQGGYMYAVNGPTSSAGETVRAKGFVIDVKESSDIVSVFGSKVTTHLGTPHALAVARDASAIYIAEINPYRIVKLVKEGSPAALSSSTASPSTANNVAPTNSKDISDISQLINMDVPAFSTSLIILSILAVPLLIIIIVVSIKRLRSRGCCRRHNGTPKLNLGNLLGHRDPVRGGFEKLAMEDSDGDGEVDSDSDADVVEYTKAKRGNNFSA